ncbi:hypothetical protein GF357_00140 [Candidatus Dojkabacteria bacterium]|nr:hypothetical protein [Candidatus Dojkabacteria bacterium]
MPPSPSKPRTPDTAAEPESAEPGDKEAINVIAEAVNLLTGQNPRETTPFQEWLRETPEDQTPQPTPGEEGKVQESYTPLDSTEIKILMTELADLLHLLEHPDSYTVSPQKAQLSTQVHNLTTTIAADQSPTIPGVPFKLLGERVRCQVRKNRNTQPNLPSFGVEFATPVKLSSTTDERSEFNVSNALASLVIAYAEMIVAQTQPETQEYGQVDRKKAAKITELDPDEMIETLIDAFTDTPIAQLTIGCFHSKPQPEGPPPLSKNDWSLSIQRYPNRVQVTFRLLRSGRTFNRLSPVVALDEDKLRELFTISNGDFTQEGEADRQIDVITARILLKIMNSTEDLRKIEDGLEKIFDHLQEIADEQDEKHKEQA